MIISGATLTGVTVKDAAIATGNSQLLYLDAGNPASYPGSGSTWYDISGNGNDTTGTTNTAYSSSNGGYFTFTPNGWFTTNSAKYNTTYTGKTVFLAAKLANNMSNSTYRCIFGSNGSSRNFNLYMYRNSSGNYAFHFSSGSSTLYGSVSNTVSYTAGNWFTVACTHTTGGVLAYYFNGQLVNTATGVTFSQYLSTTSENVGSSDNYWDGPISVACIYGSALTAQQIATSHNAVRARYGL